jgi:hypothetical protein
MRFSYKLIISMAAYPPISYTEFIFSEIQYNRSLRKTYSTALKTTTAIRRVFQPTFTILPRPLATFFRTSFSTDNTISFIPAVNFHNVRMGIPTAVSHIISVYVTPHGSCSVTVSVNLRDFTVRVVNIRSSALISWRTNFSGIFARGTLNYRWLTIHTLHNRWFTACTSVNPSTFD